MDYAAVIRQQAEDLQEELKDLGLWQEEIISQEAANRKGKPSLTNIDTPPPIRGTVPSLKDAVLKATSKENKEDPVQIAKEKGNELFQAGKITEAIEAYSRGIDIDSKGAVAHVLYGNRALCYLKQEQWANAERDASLCISLNRTYPKGFFRRAMARKQLGKLKEARTDMEVVLALMPNDESAAREIKTITQMLQLEKENAGFVKKKKIVIAEVDDDDDDDDDDGDEKDGKKTMTQRNGENVDRDVSFVPANEHVHKEIEELERAREAQRQLQESKARYAEAQMNRGLRKSERVEVVEEVEPVSAKVERPATVSTTQEKKMTETDSHYAASHQKSSKPPPHDQKKQHVAPRLFKATSRWSKETLKVPKSFTEFERVFTEIKENDELCCYYISLVSPASLAALFGNNMTPEILLGLLRTVKLLPGNVAIAFLKGLCAVKRVEDISLFFDSSEKKIVEEVLDVVLSCGASDKDMCLFRERLRMV